MDESYPLIVDVKRGATEDGPGIRTTLFFKGCPLSCVWCQNPEAIEPELEIGFFENKCIACKECGPACPNDAICVQGSDRIVRSRCVRCGACAVTCPPQAIRQIGIHYEIEALVELILRDRSFYNASNGGVTLGGGEPTLYPQYAGKLLYELKKAGIHTALQTCGHFNYSAVEANMLPFLDLIMFDIKLMNSDDHARFTGRGNTQILDNFVRLAQSGMEILPRTPLIPGYTDSTGNLEAITRFLKKHHIHNHQLLKYNPLGQNKWAVLGKRAEI